MRTILFFVIIMLFCQTIVAAPQKVRLQLHEGQTISFCHQYTHESDLGLGFGNYSIKESFRQWEIEVHVDKKLNANKYLLTLVPLRFISNEYNLKGIDEHFDSMFPPAADPLSRAVYPTAIYDIVNQLSIKMGLDVEKNELIVLENEKLEKEIRQQLESKKLPEAEYAFKEISNKVEDLCQLATRYLLRYNNSVRNEKELSLLGKSDFLLKKQKEYWQLTRNDSILKEGRAGVRTEQALLDSRNGLLRELCTVDTLPSIGKNGKQRLSQKTMKEVFFLRKNSINTPSHFTLKGHFDTNKTSTILIEYLNDPVGTEMERVEAILDQDKKFTLNIPLTREGLILFRIGTAHMPFDFDPMCIYAEPGDSIYIDCKYNKQEIFRGGSGDTMQYGKDEFAISVYGDAEAENRWLQNSFLRHKPVFTRSVITTNSISTEDRKFIQDFLDYFYNISKKPTVQFSDDAVSAKALYFMEGEAEMKRLLMTCSFINMYAGDVKFKQDEKLSQEIQKIEEYIEEFKIARFFREQGFFSRMALSHYYSYMARKNLKYASPLTYKAKLSVDLNRLNSVSEDLFFQKSNLDALMAGAALIHGKINLLTSNLNSSRRNYKKYDRMSWYQAQQQFAKEIMQNCNNAEVNAFVQHEMDKASDLHNGKLFSRKLFLTPEGDSASISDYLGKKACIITICRDWGQNRYFFDDLSEKYPNINAIVINQGNDFEKWKDYLKRAEPKAIQLFLVTKKENLESLFFNYTSFDKGIVFDKHGDLLDFEANLYTIENYIKRAQNPPAKPKELDRSMLIGIVWFMGGSFLLFGIVFIVFRIRMKRHLKKQEQEKRLRELQLAAIRAQMNPHFLFNSLNSVQNLIQKNKGREAHLYLAEFANLIRRVMKNSQHEDISLTEELETLKQYLELEKFRFDFDYEMKIDSAIDTNHFMVPSMILQPVAENALLHGLQHKSENKKLLIEVSKTDDGILMAVEDNGVGIEAAKLLKSNNNGIGLKMNEERLRIMGEKYKGNYSVSVIDLFALGREGTRVEITIPEEI